jgi:hypothetical protein
MSFASVDQKPWCWRRCLLRCWSFDDFLPKRQPVAMGAGAAPGFTAACLWAPLLFGTPSGNTFIYFQF